eukprot:3719906-Pleurochrysis_carterae.AAC.2
MSPVRNYDFNSVASAITIKLALQPGTMVTLIGVRYYGFRGSGHDFRGRSPPPGRAATPENPKYLAVTILTP